MEWHCGVIVAYRIRNKIQVHVACSVLSCVCVTTRPERRGSRGPISSQPPASVIKACLLACLLDRVTTATRGERYVCELSRAFVNLRSPRASCFCCSPPSRFHQVAIRLGSDKLDQRTRRVLGAWLRRAHKLRRSSQPLTSVRPRCCGRRCHYR
jgi:hypothetical protein